MASSQGHRAAQRGTLGVRGTQAVGAVFGHLGGADGWDMVEGHPSTIAGRQGCWVLLTRPNLTVLNHKKPDLSYGEVCMHMVDLMEPVRTVLLFGSQTYASGLPPVFNSNPHPLVSAPIVQPHAVPIRQALVQLQRPTG